MNPINNIVKAALNLGQAIAGLLVPQGASTAVRTKAELAVIGGHQVPEWLQVAQANPAGFLEAANIKGAVPVLSAGVLDGSDQLALVRFWGAPSEDKAKAKGATIWASTEASKVYAYFRAWGQKDDAVNPAAEVTAINPETGEAENWRMPVPAGIACLKFKLDGLGYGYEAAVHAIANYVSTQDGGRKDYVLLAQCNGKHRAECNTLGVPVTLNGKGILIQPIKGYILLEVPKVSSRGNANLAELCAPRTVVADAADTATAQASARVTPVMSIDASPLAAADEL